MKKTPFATELFQNHDKPILDVSGIGGDLFEFRTYDAEFAVYVKKGLLRSQLKLGVSPGTSEVIMGGRYADCVSRLYGLRDTLYRRMRDREEEEKRIAEEKERNRQEREEIEAAEAEEAASLDPGKKGFLLASVAFFAVMLAGGVFSVIDMNRKMGAPLLSGAQGVSEQPTEVRESAATPPSPGIRALSPEDVPDELVKSYLTDLEENDPAPRYEEPVPDLDASAANASEDETSQTVALSPRAGANNTAPEAASGRDLLSRFYGNAGGSSSLTERKANLKRIWDERKDENGISDIPGPDTFTAIKGTAKVPAPGGGNLDSLSQITDFGFEAE